MRSCGMRFEAMQLWSVTKLYLPMPALFVAKVISRVCKKHPCFVTDWREIGTPQKLNVRFAKVSGQLLVSSAQNGRFRERFLENFHISQCALLGFWCEPRAEQSKLSIKNLRRSWA